MCSKPTHAQTSSLWNTAVGVPHKEHPTMAVSTCPLPHGQRWRLTGALCLEHWGMATTWAGGVSVWTLPSPSLL